MKHLLYGLIIAAALTAQSAYASTIKVDHIRITVYYTPAAPAAGNDVLMQSGTVQVRSGTLIVR